MEQILCCFQNIFYKVEESIEKYLFLPMREHVQCSALQKMLSYVSDCVIYFLLFFPIFTCFSAEYVH